MQDVARGIGLDNRIGTQVPACRARAMADRAFPRTRWRWSRPAQDFDSPLRLVETTVAINEQRKRAMARKVIAACGGEVRGKTIAVLGLTFKPNTDDMREAPSLDIIQALLDAGARVAPIDPQGMDAAAGSAAASAYGAGAYDVAADADCLVSAPSGTSSARSISTA